MPGVWQYYRNGFLTGREFIIAAWIAAGFAAGTWTGGGLVPYLPVTLLRFVFGLALVFMAVRFLMASDAEAAAALCGLVAVALAWIAWFALRLLGRKHLKKPNLAAAIQENYRPTPSSEYHI